MRSVTWNRFPIKNLRLGSFLFQLWTEIEAIGASTTTWQQDNSAHALQNRQNGNALKWVQQDIRSFFEVAAHKARLVRLWSKQSNVEMGAVRSETDNSLELGTGNVKRMISARVQNQHAPPDVIITSDGARWNMNHHAAVNAGNVQPGYSRIARREWRKHWQLKHAI